MEARRRVALPFFALSAFVAFGVSAAPVIDPNERDETAAVEAALVSLSDIPALVREGPKITVLPDRPEEEYRRIVTELFAALNLKPLLQAAEANRRAMEVLELTELIDEAYARDALETMAVEAQFRESGKLADRIIALPARTLWNHAGRYALRVRDFEERARMRQAVRRKLESAEALSLREAFKGLLFGQDTDGEIRSLIEKWRDHPINPDNEAKRMSLTNVLFLRLGVLYPAVEEVEAVAGDFTMSDLYLRVAEDFRDLRFRREARILLEKMFLRQALEAARSRVTPEECLKAAAEVNGSGMRERLEEHFSRHREDVRDEVEAEIRREHDEALAEDPTRRHILSSLLGRALGPDRIDEEAALRINQAVEAALDAEYERKLSAHVYRNIKEEDLTATDSARQDQVRKAYHLMLGMEDPGGRWWDLRFSDGEKESFEKGVFRAALLIVPAGAVARLAGGAVATLAAKTTTAKLAQHLLVRAVTAAAFHTTMAAIQTPLHGSMAWENYWRGVMGAAIMFGALDAGKYAFHVVVRNGLLPKAFAKPGPKPAVNRFWDPSFAYPLRAEGELVRWIGQFLTEGMSFASIMRLEKSLFGQEQPPSSFFKDWAESLVILAQLRIGGAMAAPGIRALQAGHRSRSERRESVRREVLRALDPKRGSTTEAPSPPSTKLPRELHEAGIRKTGHRAIVGIGPGGEIKQVGFRNPGKAEEARQRLRREGVTETHEAWVCRYPSGRRGLYLAGSRSLPREPLPEATAALLGRAGFLRKHDTVTFLTSDRNIEFLNARSPGARLIPEKSTISGAPIHAVLHSIRFGHADGRVVHVIRDYPLPGHPPTTVVHIGSGCSSNGFLLPSGEVLLEAKSILGMPCNRYPSVGAVTELINQHEPGLFPAVRRSGNGFIVLESFGLGWSLGKAVRAGKLDEIPEGSALRMQKIFDALERMGIAQLDSNLDNFLATRSGLRPIDPGLVQIRRESPHYAEFLRLAAKWGVDAQQIGAMSSNRTDWPLSLESHRTALAASLAQMGARRVPLRVFSSESRPAGFRSLLMDYVAGTSKTTGRASARERISAWWETTLDALEAAAHRRGVPVEEARGLFYSLFGLRDIKVGGIPLNAFLEHRIHSERLHSTAPRSPAEILSGALVDVSVSQAAKKGWLDNMARLNLPDVQIAPGFSVRGALPPRIDPDAKERGN